jgi:excisionase family DNA binding protein
MNDDRLLTVDEVADRLRVDPETVRRWLRSGKIRGIGPMSRRSGWRVRASELERLLDEQDHA